MLEEETEERAGFKYVDIYQLPNGKWEATVLGSVPGELLDTFQEASLWVMGSLAEAFVMHINDVFEDAHIREGE